MARLAEGFFIAGHQRRHRAAHSRRRVTFFVAWKEADCGHAQARNRFVPAASHDAEGDTRSMFAPTQAASPMPADHTHFDSLVGAHYAQIFGYAFRLTGCRSRAEDLTQETFLRAFRAFDSYDPKRPATHWLTRIAHNLFVDGLRGRKRPTTVSLDALRSSEDGSGVMESQVADNTYNPERALMEETLDERLEAALAALPDEYRKTIMLCDLHGLSYEEIARAFDCSMGTVRSRIHRGRKLLQKAYAAQSGREMSHGFVGLAAPFAATASTLR